MLETMLDPEVLAPETIRPLKRREYERLVDLGVFEDERIELLRGQLVVMSPQGEAHSQLTAWLGRYFGRVLDLSYEVRQHSPFAATDDSEPEPDVSISRKKKRGYYHPRKALLLIEVAESSLRKDRKIKSEIYAENRAPEYWIVDVKTRTVWVYTEPKAGIYQRVEQLGRKDRLRPTLLPKISIRVADLFATR
jgi:Uma2 family endonuclease